MKLPSEPVVPTPKKPRLGSSAALKAPPKSPSRGRSEIAAIGARNLLDSRRLYYFFHVARLGSVSAAEAVLDIAQSALTRQIQQLEAEVGEQLLQRTGRGMTLTPAGEILLRQAETILHDMAATMQLIEQHKVQEEGGHISIAFPPTFASIFMPAVVQRFVELSPNVRLTASEARTDQVYDMLASGQVDLAIVMHEATSQKVTTQKLLTEQLFVVMGAQHPWAGRQAIPGEALPGLDLVLPVSAHGTRMSIESYCADAGIHLDAQLRLDSLGITKTLLSGNRFCAVLPKLSCAAEIDAGGLVATPLDPPLKRSIFLGRLRDRPVTPPMKLLSQEIGRAVRARTQG